MGKNARRKSVKKNNYYDEKYDELLEEKIASDMEEEFGSSWPIKDNSTNRVKDLYDLIDPIRKHK
jgi:hypothetical protein